MLWLALRLPQLALDVFAADIAAATNQGHSNQEYSNQSNAQPPVLVYQLVHGSKKIQHSNATAEAMGVRKTMTLVTAEALLQAYLEDKNTLPTTSNGPVKNTPSEPPSPPYHCFERNPSREWVALQQLAALCYDFTPHVRVHNPPTLETPSPSSEYDTGLLLEISGSLKLFKGLASLCQLLQQKMMLWRYFVQLGLGPTPEGAWLLSQTCFQPGNDYCQQVYLSELDRIAIDKIDCFVEAFNQLNKMGLTQLHQIFAIPHVELGRRFGEAFIAYLDALQGKQNTALMRRSEDCEFHTHVQLNHPIADTQQLHPVITDLLQQLMQFLQREQQQCEAIEWLLHSATGDKQIITVVCQPVHSDWQLLQQLTTIHLEHVTLTFEIDCVTLVLKQHSHFHQETGDLFSADAELALDQQAVARRWQLLLAQLHNRLGDRSALQLDLQAEHWPEQQNHWHHCQIQSQTKTIEPALPNTTNNTTLAPRPHWLIHPPVTLTQRNHQLFWRGPLTLLLGPERLQGQWWQPDKKQYRDYFIAEQNDCRRLWVYHDHQQKQWFLQGVFG